MLDGDPDQIPGRRDEWIDPVRLNEPSRWERLVGRGWMEFDGPSGGYLIHVGDG